MANAPQVMDDQVKIGGPEGMASAKSSNKNGFARLGAFRHTLVLILFRITPTKRLQAVLLTVANASA
jgi:hypothetical protein